MLNFNHVRFFNLCTDRIHHINHGLQLNKKGKDWVAHNLVKKIRNLYLTDNTSSPIVLPWRDANDNIFQTTQGNENCLNEINRSTYDQINKTNKDKSDKMLPKPEPSRKSNRIKKATSIKQSNFYGQCKPKD
ncbi:MAG: hypothetical protein LBD41_02095 [Clostridiales Family XIII bacterium]|jgi:hypothetical protein|nr:hypothetical protein [Clostridiales Family XIII bacterium]